MVDQCDLLIVPVGIGGDFGADRRLFEKHRLVAAANDPYVGAQIDGISQPILTRLNLDRAAAKASHIVHGRLQHAMIAAD